MADLDPQLEKELREITAKIAKQEGQDPDVVFKDLVKDKDPEALIAFVKDNHQKMFTPDLMHKREVLEENKPGVALTPPKPKPTPTLDAQQKFEGDFTEFVRMNFGKEAAKDDDFKLKVAATLALMTALQMNADLENKRPPDKPNLSIADLIALEQGGMNPDLEARLRHLLAMKGIMQQDDILYGAEIPPDIRQQFELLGNNPHGETQYNVAMRNMGIDQSAVSLVSDNRLQQQTPNLTEVYNQYQPAANAKTAKLN